MSDSPSGKGPVDRRGFFGLMAGRSRAGPPPGQHEQPDRPTVRVVCGGWIEVREEELIGSGGLGELVAEYGRSDLGLALLVAGPRARAGAPLAAAGVSAVLVPGPLPGGAAADLERASLTVLTPASYDTRDLGDVKVALVAGEVREPEVLDQAVRAAAASADAVIAALPRTAWRDGPGKVDRRAAEAAAAAGAAAVLVGPGAAWAGLERQGSCLVSYGLGALVPPPGVPPQPGPSSLLAVTLDRDGLHSFDTVPVRPAAPGQSPVLLVDQEADEVRRELARLSRAAHGRRSAL